MNYSLAQSRGGRLEIYFPKETKGYVTIRESVPIYDEDATKTHKFITLDSTEISNGKYIYDYKQRNLNFVYPGVYSQDSDRYIPIYTENPYFHSFNNVVYLDNSHSIIKVDSIFKTRYGETQYRGTVSGSPATDMFSRLINDEYNPEEQYKYTHPKYGHIVNFDIIRDNPDSEYLLSHIYVHRNFYSLDSLQMALSCFGKETQVTNFGKKVGSFIKYKNLFLEKGISQVFNFYDIDGNKYTFKDCSKDKKATLIIFWASWCGPCIAEIPHLQNLYEKYKDKVSFVSLSVDENKSNWISAVKKYRLAWPSLAGFPESSTKVIDVFGISAVPSFLVVDNQGQLLIDGSNTYGLVNIDSMLQKITLANIDAYFDKL
jgi:thiol-disulfide isomerase/thioredoxin